MMDKAQSLYDFWDRFDLPAYDELSVPDSAELPYIAYETQTGSLDDKLTLSASVYYRSSSWREVTAKVKEIEEFIGTGFVNQLDEGYVWIVKGSPFAQRLGDDNDDMIKRIVITVIVEFLTK